MTDLPVQRATKQVEAVLAGTLRAPQVKAFFDEPTFTVSYVVSDTATRKAVVIDSVWNFDHASGRTSFESADAIIAYVEQEGLSIEWILETHAHADHLSAAPYLQQKLGGKLAIGREIVTVQGVFGKIFNEGTELARDGAVRPVARRWRRPDDRGHPAARAACPGPHPGGYGLCRRRRLVHR